MSASVSTTNSTATHVVIFARRTSHDFALFLDRKVSAMPEIEPDRPWVLPGWNKTIIIKVMESNSCTIARAIFNSNTPENQNIQSFFSVLSIVSNIITQFTYFFNTFL